MGNKNLILGITENRGKFDNVVFQTELREALKRVESHNYKGFEQTFLSLLNVRTPTKNKKQCANHESYMTKTLHKAIMKQSEIASKYHKTKNAKKLQHLQETKKI